MSWNPITNIPSQYHSNGKPASGAVLKFYEANTSTPLSLATDDTGNELASDVKLNADGYPEISGNVIIPHLEKDYKIALYPDQGAADSNTGAVWTIDQVSTGTPSSNQWLPSNVTPVRVSDNSFYVTGDQTALFTSNRRIRLNDSGGIDYATVTNATYADPETTVTVAIDNGGALDSGLSAVDLSILTGDNLAIPAIYKTFARNQAIGTDNISLNITPAIAGYFKGLEITFQAGGDNTGNTTLNVNNLGDVPILDYDGDQLRANDLEDGKMYVVAHDGTNFALLTRPVRGTSGLISMWGASTLPEGWLECDGASVDRATYPDLFNAIGTAYGNVDANTFNLPDLRGQFIRGFDNGAGIDPNAADRTDRGDGATGDEVGTKQTDELAAHTHTHTRVVPGGGGVDTGGGAQFTGSTTGSTGGDETRPANIALMFIIKI